MGLFGNLYSGAKSVVRGLAPLATAKEPCTDTVLIEGEGEVCVEELLLDIDTGKLVRAGASSAVLVWDGYTSEWVTSEELNRRQADRIDRQAKLREAAKSGEGAQGIQREPSVFDSIGGEWVCPAELQKRTAERSKMASAVVQAFGSTPLPNLNKLSGLKITLSPEGAALLAGESATEVLERAESEPGLLDDLRRKIKVVGPKGRADDAAARRRLVILSLITAIVVALILRRRA